MLADPEIVSKVLENVSKVPEEDTSLEIEILVDQQTSVTPAHPSPPSRHVVSLDRNSGFSTVHVFHEDDGSAPCKADDSGDPFLLVSNRKCSRKAAKD
ncbi:hypothetical protein F2Q69_00027226 [Brassica cretica]|uniref:Uncharacterized protein n=1 Tax=Brassica cretica TaxID=69181 RepID=A0A8S9RV20_BRACR|nr:hypothetical protein F2Q69_00027226 [Brassica cretica]